MLQVDKKINKVRKSYSLRNYLKKQNNHMIDPSYFAKFFMKAKKNIL